MNSFDPVLIDSMKAKQNYHEFEGPEVELYNRIRYGLKDEDIERLAIESSNYVHSKLLDDRGIDSAYDYFQSFAQMVINTAYMDKRKVLLTTTEYSFELAHLFLRIGAQGKRKFYAELEQHRVSQRVINGIEAAIEDQLLIILDDARHDLAARVLGLEDPLHQEISQGV